MTKAYTGFLCANSDGKMGLALIASTRGKGPARTAPRVDESQSKPTKMRNGVNTASFVACLIHRNTLRPIVQMLESRIARESRATQK